MKIAYIASATVPSRTAYSIHVMKMCEALAEAGHEVTLLLPRRSEAEKGIADIFAYYGVVHHYRLTFLPWPEFAGGGYVFSALATAHCRRAGSQLVYTRFLSAASFATLLRLKTILEVHAPPWEYGSISRFLFVRLAKGQLLRRLVVISETLRKEIATRHPALESRTLVAHDASSDVAPVPPEARAFAPGTGFIVGYVGQLYDGKGMEVIAKLPGLLPEAEFHVVGGYDRDVAKWKRRCGHLRNIFFHGFVPPGNIWHFLEKFDVVLAPYQRAVKVYGGQADVAKWMSPLKIFEYMAAGKAIVCSDLPVLREVLEEGVTALFCNPEDPSHWERTLQHLELDASLREGLGSRARERYAQLHTWKARVERILASI